MHHRARCVGAILAVLAATLYPAGAPAKPVRPEPGPATELEAGPPPWEAAPRDGLAAPGWMARHRKFLDSARPSAPQLLFVGDSITQQWEAQGLPVWRQHYVPRKAFELGINGDTTQNVLWRIDNGELDGLSPKVTVLLIGTNNIRHAPPADVVRGIAAVAAAIRRKLPGTHLIVLALFPRSPRPDDPMRLGVAAVNRLLAGTDFGPHSSYLDLGGSFLEPDGTLSAAVMADGLHPTARGYEVWAAALEPVVNPLLH